MTSHNISGSSNPFNPLPNENFYLSIKDDDRQQNTEGRKTPPPNNSKHPSLPPCNKSIKDTPFRISYDNFKKQSEQIKKVTKRVLVFLEYTSNNRPNFIYFASIASHEYRVFIEQPLQSVYEIYKWVNCIAHLAISLGCLYYIHNLNSDFQSLRKNFIKSDLKLDESFNEFITTLHSDKSEEFEKGAHKFLKLLSLYAAKHLKKKGFEQEIADKAAKGILAICENLFIFWKQAQNFVLLDQFKYLNNIPQPKEQTTPLNEKIDLNDFLKKALENKKRVDKNFLRLKTIHSIVGLCAAALQLFVCFAPNSSYSKNTYIKLMAFSLSRIVSPRFKLIYLGHPLYPDLSLRTHKLLIQGLKFIFDKAYKPNEYSLEGHLLKIKIQWRKLLLYKKDEAKIKELEKLLRERQLKDAHLIMNKNNYEQSNPIQYIVNELKNKSSLPEETKSLCDKFGLSLKSINEDELTERLEDFFCLN